MKDNFGNASDQVMLYRSPEVRVIFVKAQGVLCQSGNEPMSEYDYGSGGFAEK